VDISLIDNIDQSVRTGCTELQEGGLNEGVLKRNKTGNTSQMLSSILPFYFHKMGI
jgi:hypothetical protein